jgi:hypothetical protein
MGGEELLEPYLFVRLQDATNLEQNRTLLHVERLEGVTCRKHCGADLSAGGWLELVLH